MTVSLLLLLTIKIIKNIISLWSIQTVVKNILIEWMDTKNIKC